MAKTSLLVLVQMSIVYTENVHCNFLPQIFTAWRSTLQRMFLPRLTELSCFSNCTEQHCLLAYLYIITPPPCTAVCNNPTSLFNWSTAGNSCNPWPCLTLQHKSITSLSCYTGDQTSSTWTSGWGENHTKTTAHDQDTWHKPSPKQYATNNGTLESTPLPYKYMLCPHPLGPPIGASLPLSSSACHHKISVSWCPALLQGMWESRNGLKGEPYDSE